MLHRVQGRTRLHQHGLGDNQLPDQIEQQINFLNIDPDRVLVTASTLGGGGGSRSSALGGGWLRLALLDILGGQHGR